MVRVSKRRLKENALLRLHERFAHVIADTRTLQGGKQLLEELLTPSERVMLAKRLAIIFMLLEDVSPYYIAQILKVSTSTTQRIQKQLKAREFPHLVRALEKHHNRKQFWNEVEAVIRLGMPPKGRGRWRWFYEMEGKYRLQGRR
jgi:Trp operon repressor